MKISWWPSQFLSLLNSLRSLLLPKNVFLRVKLGLENFHVPFGENVVLELPEGPAVSPDLILRGEKNAQKLQQGSAGQDVALQSCRALYRTLRAASRRGVTLRDPSLDLPTDTARHTSLYLPPPCRILLAHVEM